MTEPAGAADEALPPPGICGVIVGCGAWLLPLGKLGPVPLTPPRPLPIAVEPPIGPPGATPCACACGAIRMTTAAETMVFSMSAISDARQEASSHGPSRHLANAEKIR